MGLQGGIPRSGRRWLRTAIPTVIALGLIAAVALYAFISSLNQAPSSGGGLQFSTFQGDGFDFDYPRQWQVISRYQHAGMHGPTVLAAVGIGDFDLGCSYTSTSVTCDAAPHWTVPANGAVLAYHFSAWLGPTFVEPTPSLGPGDRWVEVGGRAAILSTTDQSMVWHFPGAPEFIEAHWGSLAAAEVRSQVQMVIDSWRWAPAGASAG
jgi:hypothetical protein